MSGMVLPICNVAVARRLGLHPEEDGEEQHYEKEEYGATDGQGHDHLWAGGGERKVTLAFSQQMLSTYHMPGTVLTYRGYAGSHHGVYI